jgi:cobalt-zinc-cadmium efflux system membrane fusion protein
VNRESPRPIGRWAATLVLMAASALAGWFFARARPAEPALKAPAASSIGKKLDESEITTVTISDEARKKLAVRAAPVERRTLKRVRFYGGEVMVPPGQLMTISAPLGGQVKAPAEGMPRPGQAVKQGQPILTFVPILSPDARANLAGSLSDAEGTVKTAKAQFDLASINFQRADDLFKNQAGPKRAVDDTQAALKVARETLDMVESRRALFAKVLGETVSGSPNAIVLPAPLDGILKDIHATTGDTVPANAPLFVVTRLDPMWIRVPIYVGDLGDIDATAAASIVPLGGAPSKALTQAQPVAAPPSATALASSLDLFFEMPNKATAFRPGQRLGVTLALKSDQDNLVVPWSAVVHDIHGGAWVYEQLEPTKFLRRRVLLKHVQDDIAVLVDGPAVGTHVVVDGAEELFGIEVGFAK